MATHSTIFLPGKSHGQGSLAGSSPSGRQELDETAYTHKGNKEKIDLFLQQHL